MDTPNHPSQTTLVLKQHETTMVLGPVLGIESDKNYFENPQWAHPTGASEKFQCQKAISLSDWADSIAVLPHRSAAQSIDNPSCRDSLHSSRWFQWRFFFPWFTHRRLTQPDSTLLDVRERGTNSPFPDPHQQFPLKELPKKKTVSGIWRPCFQQ